MVKVKICGLTDPRQVAAITSMLPDAVGFIRVPGPRRIDDEALLAASRERTLKDRVLWAGVFVDAGAAEVAAETELYGFDILQLHGRESPDWIAGLKGLLRRKVMIFKTLDPGLSLAPEEYLGLTDAFLVDTAIARGGTGRSWDFGRIAVLRQRCPAVPVWIAGGLSPENLPAVLREARPDGVDVSSGVEGEIPGVKDLQRVKSFIETLRREGRGRQLETI